MSVLLVVLVAAISYALGYHGASQKYTSAYYFTHIKLNQPTVPRTAHMISSYVPPPPVDQGGVFLKYLDPTWFQGPLGICQCAAFRYQFDYLFNLRNHTYRHFSCKFWASIVHKGANLGSYLADYPPILQAQGAVTDHQFGWSGTPTTLTWPLSPSIYAEARPHRYALATHVIQQGYGANDSAINAAERVLAQHRPINLGFDVYGGPGSNGPMDVNQNNGVIDVPSVPILGAPHCQVWEQDLPAFCLGGAHALTGIAFYNHLCLTTSSGRTCGFIKVLNSWDRWWGVNCRTGRFDYGHGGCAFMSIRFIKHLCDEIDYISLTKLAPQGSIEPVWSQPGPLFDKPLPPPTKGRVNGGPLPLPPLAAQANTGGDTSIGLNQEGNFGAGDAYVWHVFVRDAAGDQGPLINAAAHANNISAPGLLATLFAECGLYTTSPTCDRWGYWPDVSFGWCQVTVSTAGGFGVGGGTYNWSGYVRSYDDVISHCVYLGARVLGNYKSRLGSIGCPIDFPALYVAWNAGPNNPCWWLHAPSGQAGTNYYGNFMANWSNALSYAVGYNPYSSTPVQEVNPPPPPIHFNYKGWYSYQRVYGGKKISPWYHGKLSWAATVWMQNQWLQGVTGAGTWDVKGAYMRYPFYNGAMYCWPRYNTCSTRFIFATALYNRYRRAHHLKSLSHTYHGDLSWGARVFTQYVWLKGAMGDGTWYAHDGYMKQRFVGGCSFRWPKYHTDKEVHNPC